ncbi:MAG: DUF6427 family protein [Bacteroidales bacterium]
MLIRYFKSSYLSQIITLILLGLLLWGKAFIFPEVYAASTKLQPAFELVNGAIKHWPVAAPILGYLLLVFQAMFLNATLNEHELVSRNTLIPAFVLIILGSQVQETLTFHPASVANIFIILSFKRMLKCYDQHDSRRDILSASIYISVASMFFFPSIVFLLLVWSMLISFSIATWKEWIISMIGAATPYIYLFSLYYIAGAYPDRLAEYFRYFTQGNTIQLPHDIMLYVIWGLTAILIIFSWFFYLLHFQEKNIMIRKKISLFLWFLLFSLLPSFFAGEAFPVLEMVIAIPLTVLVAFYLDSISRRTTFQNALLWMLLMAMLINNYNLI